MHSQESRGLLDFGEMRRGGSRLRSPAFQGGEGWARSFVQGVHPGRRRSALVVGSEGVGSALERRGRVVDAGAPRSSHGSENLGGKTEETKRCNTGVTHSALPERDEQRAGDRRRRGRKRGHGESHSSSTFILGLALLRG